MIFDFSIVWNDVFICFVLNLYYVELLKLVIYNNNDNNNKLILFVYIYYKVIFIVVLFVYKIYLYY